MYQTQKVCNFSSVSTSQQKPGPAEQKAKRTPPTVRSPYSRSADTTEKAAASASCSTLKSQDIIHRCCPLPPGIGIGVEKRRAEASHLVDLPSI